MSLPDLLATATFDDACLVATISDAWLQGRTAYGGLSAALALAAAKAAFNDLPPLRSAQLAFVGPLSGQVRATPSLLRRGKNSAFIAVDAVGDGRLGLRALFLFLHPRASVIRHDAMPCPSLPLAPASAMDTAHLPQGFLSQFEILPWERDTGTFRAWRRLQVRDGLDPEVELLAVADALPPAAMSLMDQWGPVSTTLWQLNLVGSPVSVDGWYLLEAVTNQAGDGASAQTMSIWNSVGRPVATATQSVALFV